MPPEESQAPKARKIVGHDFRDGSLHFVYEDEVDAASHSPCMRQWKPHVQPPPNPAAASRVQRTQPGRHANDRSRPVKPAFVPAGVCPQCHVHVTPEHMAEHLRKAHRIAAPGEKPRPLRPSHPGSGKSTQRRPERFRPAPTHSRPLPNSPAQPFRVTCSVCGLRVWEGQWDLHVKKAHGDSLQSPPVQSGEQPLPDTAMRAAFEKAMRGVSSER